MAMVLISHDLGVVAENCDRVAVMYAGRIVEEAPLDAALRRCRAIPIRAACSPRCRRSTARAGGSSPIPGTVPEPRSLPPGCAFAPRCAAGRGLCARAAATCAPSATTDASPASVDQHRAAR